MLLHKVSLSDRFSIMKFATKRRHLHHQLMQGTTRCCLFCWLVRRCWRVALARPAPAPAAVPAANVPRRLLLPRRQRRRLLWQQCVSLAAMHPGQRWVVESGSGTSEHGPAQVWSQLAVKGQVAPGWLLLMWHSPVTACHATTAGVPVNMGCLDPVGAERVAKPNAGRDL